MTTLQLGLWLQKRLVAEISYSPTEEQWSLRYSAGRRSDPEAFPLSPALSLEQDISSSAIRRFLEIYCRKGMRWILSPPARASPRVISLH